MDSSDFEFFDVSNSLMVPSLLHLKVHKREKFFGSDFEFFTIL
jgi:hypothetical protein